MRIAIGSKVRKPRTCIALRFSVGEETCEMAPWSDSYGVALNALLLSTALLGVCERQRRDLKQHYTQLFR